MSVLSKFAAAAMALSSLGTAQTSSLTGTVADTSGAIIPGVKIELVNVLTSEEYSTVSNALGT